MDHQTECEARFKTSHLPKQTRDTMYQSAHYKGHSYGIGEVESEYEDIAEIVIAAADACVKVKVGQIVAFLHAKADKMDDAIEAMARRSDDRGSVSTAARLQVEAGHARAFAAQIERREDEAPR